jgi:hypothetical protein
MQNCKTLSVDVLEVYLLYYPRTLD